MKNLVTVILFVCFLLQGFPVLGKEKDSRSHEVIVRVFDKETQIESLKKEDFTLYENNKPRAITGFKVTKKNVRPASSAASFSRIFILEFHLSDYNPRVRKDIDFVFDYILDKKDRLVIAAGDRVLFFQDLPDKIQAIAVIEGVLRDQANRTRRQMDAEITAMETFINDVRIQAKQDVDPTSVYGRLTGVHPHYYMKYLKNSIERYLDMLLGYKKKYLLPNISGYYNLSTQFAANDKEKWLISFFRMPVLPKFSRRNRQMISEWITELSRREWLDELDYTKKLGRLQGDIDEAFDVSGESADNLFREVVQLLYQTGFTFHSIFLPSRSETGSRTTGEKAQVKASIEKGMKNRLKEISRLTGGTFCDGDTSQYEPGNNPILKKEDVYYTLIYTPQNAGDGNIKVELDNKRYQAVYTDFSRSEGLKRLLDQEKILTSNIKIEKMTFKNKKLSLTIRDFAIDQFKKTKEQPMGKLNILVRIIDSQNRVVFGKEKALLAQKTSVFLSLDFQWLKKGKYHAFIDVKDLITGKAWAQVFLFQVP
ncbi:MAG: hypothetical protein PVH61_14915 [Candidatus Aminicenantes bacterium]|jgi:hypothetical protein